MRKFLVGLGLIVIVIIVIVTLTLPRLIDVNRYRPQIEARLEQRLGREVSLGQMSLSLYPLAFRVENATIAEDADFHTERPFAQIATLYVSPQLWPLLRNEIQIDRLELRDPNLELVRNEKGIWNFSSLAIDKGGKPKNFSLDKLKVFNGQVGITDLQESKSRSQYDHIDLILGGFTPGKSFSIETRAHMSGSGDQMIVLKGKAGPIRSRGDFSRTPFTGNLELTAVSLSGLRRFVKIDGLTDSEAILTGSAYVANESGSLTSRGKFDARDASIRGVKIGYPITAEYDISNNIDEKTVHIEKANLKLGQTPMSVTGSIDARPANAVVDLTIQSLNASIRETARLAAALGVAFDAKTDVDGKLDLNVHANGPSNQPALNGQIDARDVRIRGGDLREPVQADAIALSLTPASIRSNAFTAKTGQTTLTAQISLSNYTSDAPQMDLKLNSNNAEVGELLRIGQAYGVSAVRGMSGSGSVTINIDAHGPLKHTDKLTFTGGGSLRNASFNLTSMTQPVQVRNADLRFTANSVVLDNLELAVGHTDARGRLTAHNFADPRVEFSLTANQANVQELETIFKSKERSGGDGSVLTRISGSGQLAVDTVNYDQVTLKDVHSTVALDRGVITLKPITAALYNGQQTGAIVINARAHPATYTVDSKLQNVDANQLLSSISSIKDSIYGVLTANADLHFVTTAGSANIVRSLTGRASLNLKDGKIAHMDFLHSLATIGKFYRTASAVKPFTDLIQLNGDFDINNGVGRTRNLKAVIPDGSVAADGVVDLVQQVFNLRVMAVLSKEYSELVGGTNIAGWMSTVLANRNGELVIPVFVTGNFKNPQFAPDLQRVAEMKLENLVPNLQNPADLRSRILGEIFREKPEPTRQQNQENQQQPQAQQPLEQQKPGKALRDILEKVLKGKNGKQLPNP